MASESWTLYILRCRDDSLYTGITNDLDARVRTHNEGRASKYTRSRLPVRVVYTEPAGDRSQALKREAAVKRLSREGKLAMLDR